MDCHNAKNYARDLDAVAGFDFLSAPAGRRPESLAACARIGRALEGGDAAGIGGRCRELEKLTGVGGPSALARAVLAVNGGYVRSAERLARGCGLPQEEADAVLSELSGAGLVNQLEDAPGIILSELSVRMLREDRTREAVMQGDLLDILRSGSDAEDPCDDQLVLHVVEDVREYVSRYPGSRLGRFSEENGLDSLADDEYREFVLLCRAFVLSFTAGRKAERGSAAVKAMVNRGWAVLFAAQGDSEDGMIKQNNMILSPGVCRRLFGGMEELIDLSSIMGQTRVVRWSEIEEKTLFYNDEDAGSVERLYRMAGEEEYRHIAGALKAHRLKAAVSGILYGGPGTGKTELVRQVARATRRNLLVVDASKTVGSYVGEAERNYRDLFRNFRYIEAMSSRAPILFIDEADGILGKRIPDAASSRDRFVNTVQNIILEELNDFEGILLVTTNLASNLDDAMDRRFLVKIEFHAPDERTRLKIWRSKLPQVSGEDLAVVAREFPFTGGHIDNVATRAIIESIMDGSDTVTLESLINYSKDESHFTNKDSRRRIGF